MKAYFDSSAFVKLVLDESGSVQAGVVWDDADLCASTVALYAEARAAVAAARRDRRLDDISYRATLGVLHHLWAVVDSIEVNESLAFRAGELAEVHALRGYDAIHLASAEAVLDDGDVIVVSDDRLAEAAGSLGLEAVTPAD